jgi:hypothetical protein
MIDWQLNALPLHEALCGCRNRRGTRMAILEAKLTQRLAHLEQEPFYRVLLDLKKGVQHHGQGEMPPDSGGIWHGAEHGSTDLQLLERRNHGLLSVGELRGTVLCWPRHDPGGTTINQAVQHFG